MRNNSHWSEVVFEIDIYFSTKTFEFYLETLELDFEVSKSSIWSTQLRVTRVLFLSLLSLNFDDELSSNFHRLVILCICWDTPSETTCLWQLPIVSTVQCLWLIWAINCIICQGQACCQPTHGDETCVTPLYILWV